MSHKEGVFGMYIEDLGVGFFGLTFFFGRAGAGEGGS